jgi:hypothetical protein
MGNAQTWRMDASSTSAARRASFTSNRNHIAFARSGSIYVGKLDSVGNYERRCAALRPHPFGLSPILALSPLRTHLLAISTGSRTSIWDVKDDNLKYTIYANERSVTSLAWSNHDPDVLALGHIDGQVSVWNLGHLIRPKHVWLGGAAQCHLLSWSLAAPPTLVVCSGQMIATWNNNDSNESLAKRYDLGYQADRVLWRPHPYESFMTLASDGTYDEWRTTNMNSIPLESNDCQDQDFFGDLDDLQSCQMDPMSQGNLPSGSQISIVGKTAVLLLAHHGRSLRLYTGLRSAENDEPIWEKQLMGRIEYVTTTLGEDGLNIVAAGVQGIERMFVPPAVREQLGDVSSSTIGDEVEYPEPERTKVNSKRLATMHPVPIYVSPRAHKSHRDVRLNPGNVRLMPLTRPTTAPADRKNMKTHSAVSPRQAMASSLELPKLHDEESPMPFLSPTIPSQRPSPSAIPALGDDIVLPPPENESFESLPSTAMNDSDSDDETFDGDALKGSGTLMMPGGANVPLPKSCGAFFSSNGQLITYFPPKARVRSADLDGFSSSQPEERSTKASRLFPLFGNLSLEAHDYEDSNTESMSSQSEVTSQDSPKAEMFSFSTPGERSWSEKLENMQPLPRIATGQKTVVVSIRDVNDLIHFRPELAHSYKLSCNSEEAAGRASLANADVARTAGLDDLANVWSLLGLLLQGRLPDEFQSVADADITSLARRASRLVCTSSVTRPKPSRQSSAMAVPHFSQTKAGASWLVSQIFAWTELRADVQMLACLSAVLLSSAQSTTRVWKTHTMISDSWPSLPASDYFIDGASHTSHPPARPMPLLQYADSREGSFLHSPAKPSRSSHVSSRDPSQPTTPYVDSLSSTPPFPFPKLSRQGSRLSASGSASPEHHRSSFGAAAKFYAQSITDRISSYGTSPPARRFGTSPSNELSSSIPGAGSWSKSVSFASGVNYSSRSSTRIAPDDDGYDSDRTIEDTSLPHTPKRYTGPVSFTLKNTNAFLSFKETQSQPQPQLPTQPLPPSLLSPSLTSKARIWLTHYTEQLRRIGLLTQAAELSNIASNSTSISKTPPPHAGIRPTPATASPAGKPHKATCSICYCRIQGVQQVCSLCLHTTHLRCLRGFVEDFCGGAEGEDEMECPSGCGCVCSMVAFEETVWAKSEEASVAPARTIRRKWSFTDPRRWRGQVQGDSW